MSTSNKFNHFDDVGQAHMVDISAKTETQRIAEAIGRIQMLPETYQAIVAGQHKKGDVLAVARLAGIMAAKRTSELIPLCHPIALTRVAIEFELEPQSNAVCCKATAETLGRTGVEMEALTATSVTLLTIYDMCKAMDRGMVLSGIKLARKSGGKSGDWPVSSQQTHLETSD